jgi:hypothetical protein
MTDVSLNSGQKMSTNFNCNEQSDKNEVKEYGWRYQCWNCGHQVTLDAAFPEKCPGCGAGAGGWWGHLATTDVLEKLNQKTEDGIFIENSEVAMSGGMKSRTRILSQPPDAVEHGEAQNKGIYEPSPGQGRGRPRRGIPGDLINQLSQQGLSSRHISADLAARGFNLSYKSVQRYFKRQKQGSFP